MDNETGGYTCAYNVVNNDGFEHWKLELIELSPCNSQLELRQTGVLLY